VSKVLITANIFSDALSPLINIFDGLLVIAQQRGFA
jgi:hypothetical protein